MADFVENLGFEDTFDLSSTNGFLDHPELIPNGSINTYTQSLHKHFQLSHDNIRLFFLIIATIIILICLIICISICICICLNRYVVEMDIRRRSITVMRDRLKLDRCRMTEEEYGFVFVLDVEIINMRNLKNIDC